MTLAAVAAAFVVSRSQADRYQASAVMLFGPASFTDSSLTAGGTAVSTTSNPDNQATDLALASLGTVADRVQRQLRGAATVDSSRARSASSHRATRISSP
jgi:hypothetical protein